jgi:predicted metal-dependent peptidase
VHRGLYLPSLRTTRLEVCIALDTSGSTHAMLPAMLGELHALLGSFGRWEARILWADAAVQREERWTDDDPPDLAQLRVPLGGDTDLRPAFGHVAEEPPRLMIYVTDGYGPAPSQAPPWPVLWLLPSPACPVPAPWGEVAWFGEAA